MAKRPLIAIIGDVETVDGLVRHAVDDHYARVVHDHAGGIPLLLPPVSDDPAALAGRFDGFVFAGSPSNIHPRHWDGPADAPGPFDERRDALALPLIRAVLAADRPALFICRGMQELNVALGGTLHPRLRGLGGPIDHHAPETLAANDQYAPWHDVRLAAGSPLADLFGSDHFPVNSLHYQGLDRLAPGLAAEAVAPDGLVEAVSVRDRRFAIGVQWHPEFRPDLNPPNRRLFEAFCRVAAGSPWRAP